MPRDNIDRAIKKGTGELEGVNYEELTYEGYGPGGVAMLLEVLTDNKNRTVAEVRHIFSKQNGNLGEGGGVSWVFEKKGLMTLDKKGVDEDRLMEAALDAGAASLDASIGGIGGCPFAPAATGNIPTDDLLYMLERSGVVTGVSLERIVETSLWLQQQLGRSTPAMLPKAGIFPKVAEAYRAAS